MRYSKEELEKQKQERLGEIRKSNEGYEMKIVEYNNANDMWIEFQDEHKVKVHTQYSAFKNKALLDICVINYIEMVYNIVN